MGLELAQVKDQVHKYQHWQPVPVQTLVPPLPPLWACLLQLVWDDNRAFA